MYLFFIEHVLIFDSTRSHLFQHVIFIIQDNVLKQIQHVIFIIQHVLIFVSTRSHLWFNMISFLIPHVLICDAICSHFSLISSHLWWNMFSFLIQHVLPFDSTRSHLWWSMFSFLIQHVLLFYSSRSNSGFNIALSFFNAPTYKNWLQTFSVLTHPLL